jgi:uncharacterized protein
VTKELWLEPVDLSSLHAALRSAGNPAVIFRTVQELTADAESKSIPKILGAFLAAQPNPLSAGRRSTPMFQWDRADGLIQAPELKRLESPQGEICFFDPLSYTLLRAGPSTALVLDACRPGAALETLARQGETTLEAVKDLLERVNRILISQPGLTPERPVERVLQKLVVNVSNDCNMRCVYCYAHGGSYQRPRELMSVETARQAADCFLTYYHQIGTVMFFGGEPALNPPAIQAFCDRVLELRAQKRIAHVPLWGLVTNGLEINQSLLELIQTYSLVVTVSLDGPAPIHDSLRVRAGGGATYETVSANIARIQQVTGGREPSRIETTYTQQHAQAGIGIKDLSDFAAREFGIHDVHIMPVSVENGRQEPNYIPEPSSIHAAVNTILDSWLDENPRQLYAVANSLHPLVARINRTRLCMPGRSEMTIMANGDVYPCYRLLDGDMKLGNVNAGGVFESETFQRVLEGLDMLADKSRHACRTCWARGLCQHCIGNGMSENQNRDPVSERQCQFTRDVAEALLLRLNEFQADEKTWTLFCAQLQKRIQKNLRSHLER